jgi:hypothetical protein
MGAWVHEHAAQPRDLGARITYLADPTTADSQGPNCDFAIPITLARSAETFASRLQVSTDVMP